MTVFFEEPRVAPLFGSRKKRFVNRTIIAGHPSIEIGNQGSKRCRVAGIIRLKGLLGEGRALHFAQEDIDTLIGIHAAPTSDVIVRVNNDIFHQAFFAVGKWTNESFQI
jgi:hypothetical protein